MTKPNAHRDLLDIYQTALKAVEGRTCVANHLRTHPNAGDVYLIAIGKAAASMAEGALDVLGDACRSGLVITKHGHGDERLASDDRLQCLESGHPTPDQHSLEAGAALLAFIGATPTDAHLLFLLSGGASALVEALPAGMTLADLQRVNQWLLGSGLAIGQVNRVRKALSLIKGGRLAARLGRRQAQCLLLSDVPGNDLGAIGSGPLIDSPADDLADLALPDWLSAMLAKVVHATRAEPAAIPHVILADNLTARQAAFSRAQQLGYEVVLHDALLQGDAGQVAQEIVGVVRSKPSVLHVWGGEVTVALPDRPGRGGRCQHLALDLASRIAGEAGTTLVVAGTDGSDGPTEDAGALVDGSTIKRGADAGMDAKAALDSFDAGRFLDASGDLIHTGPTGSNVMDIVLGLLILQNTLNNQNSELP